jgi:tRNA (guanine-N7-)-methyltransferase
MTQTFTYPQETAETLEILSPQWFFKEARSLEIEIGSGKGLFLTETALANLEKYFVGIETAKTYARLSEERIVRKKLANVRILNWPAELILPFFKPETASRFHIYFPDPWPKKRHRKRRVWTNGFVTHLERILLPEGKVYFATDYLEYFDAVLSLLEEESSPFVLERREDFRFFEDAAQPTSYEKKFLIEGRPLRFASFVKKVG